MRRCGMIICDEDLPGVFRRISGNTIISLDDLKQFLVPINPVFSGSSAIYHIPNRHGRSEGDSITHRRSLTTSYHKNNDYSPARTS